MNILTLRTQSIPYHQTAKISSGLGIVFSTYIVTTSLIILHLRSWDTNILMQIAVFSSYPLMFFGLVSITMCLIRTPGMYLRILPVATLIFMGLPFICNLLGLWLVLSLAMIGILLIILSASLAYGRAIWSNLFWLLCSGMVIATFYIGIVNGYDLNHIFSDVDAYTKLAHTDVLFHSAIINMLSNFSAVSTGLDGVPSLDYHVFVHRWIATFQLVAPGITPLLFAIGLQVSILPVLFFTWTLTIGLLLHGSINLLSLLPWAFGSLIVARQYQIADFYLVTESYAFSLPVFLSMIPIAQSWFLADRPNGRLERFWTLFLVFVAVIASSSAKISTFFILVVFLTSCLILPRLLKTDRRSLFLYGGLSLLISSLFIGLIYLFIWGNIPLKFMPFQYPRAFPDLFITQILFAIVCLLFFYVWGKLGSSDPWKHQILTLALAVTFAASLVPGLILDLGSPYANYSFIYSAQLILILFGLVGLINRWNSLDTKTYLSRLWTHPWSKRMVAAWCIAFFVVTQLLFILKNHFIGRFLSFWDMSSWQLSLFDQSRPVVSDVKTTNLKFRYRLKYLVTPPPIDLDRLKSLSALYRIKLAVDSAGIIPATADTLVYISPDFDEFWGEVKDVPRTNPCWAKSFQIPAVLGLPMLNGVRGAFNDCDTSPFFGFHVYDSDSLNINLSDKAACEKAQKLGFSKVFIVNRRSQYLIHCSRL